MSEMMTHGMVASMAYTLKQAGYSSSARFWTDYLENDFEAKWRKRNNKRSGFPFIDHKLMHPTVNMIRYHYITSSPVTATTTAKPSGWRARSKARCALE